MDELDHNAEFSTRRICYDHRGLFGGLSPEVLILAAVLASGSLLILMQVFDLIKVLTVNRFGLIALVFFLAACVVPIREETWLIWPSYQPNDGGVEVERVYLWPVNQLRRRLGSSFYMKTLDAKPTVRQARHMRWEERQLRHTN